MPDPSPPSDSDAVRGATAVATAFLGLYLEDRSRGCAGDLAAYQARFPGYEELIAREYAALRADPTFADGASVIEQLSRRSGAARGDPDAGAPETQRYEVREEIARGGMGAILRVWDRDLRRLLAMKTLLGDQAGVPLQRFLEEAQVTARLRHPGIVPVHELGIDDRGRIYFTMDLIEGRSLAEILPLALQGREDWSPTRALHVLSRVCDAVGYAHSHGVVHRDLKPANVMAGAFGEVYVMDWGLARAAPGDEPAGPTDDTDDADGQRTMQGDVLGTPAYMSPEQARGEHDRVGPAADVYAIGAMLYELLAGAAPYRDTARGWRETVAAVIAGPPTPVERRAHAAPELVAICGRAMAREPGDRYADVQALGRDLRAFLEDRVVHAHRTGAVAELRKWIRRNRAVAASIAVAVLSLAIGLVVAILQKERADANAERAGQQEILAREAAARADAGAGLALDAVARLLDGVGSSRLKDVPQAQPLRRRLLLDALEFYGALLETLGDDPSVRDKMAGALLQTARIHEHLGDHAAAIEAARTAIAQLDTLCDERPDDPAPRLARARAHSLIGLAHLRARDLDASGAALGRALALLESLTKAAPDDEAVLAEYGEVSRDHATLLDRSGRKEEALAAARRAAEFHERLRERFGARHAAGVAKARDTVGALIGFRDLDAALPNFEAAVAAYGEAVELDPDDHELRSAQAIAMSNLSGALVRAGQRERGYAMMGRMLEVRRALADDYPSVPLYHHLLALGCHNLAIALRDNGAPERALVFAEEAVAAIRRALALAPKDERFRVGAERHYGTLFSILPRLRRRAAILEHADALAALVPERLQSVFASGLMCLQAAELVAGDEAVPEERRKAEREACIARGLRHLRAAVDAGLRDPKLADLKAFNPVRDRPEFVRLLADLAR